MTDTASLRTTEPVRTVIDIADIEAIEESDYDAMVTAHNLHDLLLATATHCGDRPAITVLRSSDPADIGVALTHRDLLIHVRRAANLFWSLGVRRDQGVIAILCPTLPEIPVALLGAQIAGTVSMINYLLNEDAIVELLNTQGATILLAPSEALDSECWTKVSAIIHRVPSLQAVLVIGGKDDPMHKVSAYETALLRHSGEELRFDCTASRSTICALFHTGGTTGRPKLVQLTHGNQIHAAWGFAQVFGFNQQDVVLNGFPLFHVGGTMTVGLSVIAAGGHVVMLSPLGLRNPAVVENYWTIAETFRATVVSGVPTSISSLANVPVSSSDLSSVRMAVTGGAVLPRSVGERFMRNTGIRIFETYGMTETAAAIAFNPGSGQPMAGSVGFRAPFSETRIVNLRGRESLGFCAPLETGLVQVRGPQVFPGYRDPRHNTGVLSPDGWLTTGDLGYLTDDKRLVLTGREKDLIVRSGHNIDPAAIEDVANTYPGVQSSAAVAMPDQYSGEVPMLFIVPMPGQTIDVDQLKAHVELRVHEAPAKPKRLVVIESMPVTAVGKVFKPALRDLAIKEKVRMELERLNKPVALKSIDVRQDRQLNIVVRVGVVGLDDSEIIALADALKPLPQTYEVQAFPDVSDGGVLVEVVGGVATITLNKPAKRNAMSAHMMRELDSSLDRVASLDGLRVVIITGAGDAFSAGGDLLEFDELLAEGRLLEQLTYNQRVLAKLASLPCPVIAAVNGTAVAGGLELMLCCDLIVAASTAWIGDGHVRYGIVPAGGATARLPRRVPVGRAKQLFFTGELVPARTLLEWGLVNEVVEPEGLRARVDALASEICSRSPEAIRQTKALLLRASSLETAEAHAELEAFAEHLGGQDLKVGLRAFREKERPHYEGPSTREPASTSGAG